MTISLCRQRNVSLACAETERAHPTLAAGNVPILLLCSLELDGAQRPTDLAAMTRLTTGRMTQVVDTLEQDGLVRRTADPVDGRAILVEITNPGREVLTAIEGTIVNALRAHPDCVASFRDALSCFGPADAN